MSATQDFLFEIGVEEMPSAPLNNAQKQLPKLFEAALRESGLAHGAIECHSTPRRLALMVKDVATATEEVHEVKRGPARSLAFDEAGNPTKAAQGFARKMGLDASELLVREDNDGKTYVFAEKNIASKSALPILSETCESLLTSLEWPNYRSQRWGSEHASFVRPVRWLCALLGSELIPVHFADVESSSYTFGHRVLGPGAHEISSLASYRDTLRENGVLLEDERRELILEGIKKVEEERPGSHVDMPRRIFDEVVNLCEWPTVLVGKFDEEFLAVPHEIICESMLSNQRYFPIYDAQGKLTREFIIVSNADPRVSETVIDGNERVVRPRLDDAKFFYEEDLAVPLEDFVERLELVIFQERLGNVRQKTTRMEALASRIARDATNDEVQAVRAARAAHLAKADLVSQAVIEFTNQQGVMGGYYALAAGEDPSVAEAIREHYRPRFAGDELPQSVIAKSVAIADKLDTICGMFAINEPPTGSSDPFAQRRAAIGIIAMLRELPSVKLLPLISASLDSYEAQGLSFNRADIEPAICDFFAGRLASIAKDGGAAADTIDAIAAVHIIDPAEFFLRVKALDDARTLKGDLFDNLATAYARASHLANPQLGCDVDESLMQESEKNLLHACENGAQHVKNSLESGDFSAALEALADLKEPIDRFYDDVRVMDEDTVLRENRLRLLNKFTAVFADVADIGALSKKK